MKANAAFPKRLRRIVLLVPVAFLAFAPPGTLIVTALVVAGFLGFGWFLLAAGVLATAALIWLVRRRRRRL